MARPASRDPLDKFRWAVTIDGFNRLGFTSCETPSYAINTQKYAEGGAHLFPKQIVDSIEYRPVTLQRGVTSDFDFHKWAIQTFELQTNITDKDYKRDPSVSNGPQLPPLGYRRTVIIDHLDRAGRVVKRYILYNCFPVEYKPASDFASDGDDLISMEKLVLAYESFEVTTPDANKSTNPLDPRDLIKRIISRAF